MKNVSRAVIYGLVIPLPPLAEQRRIMAKVNELMAVCDRLETKLTTAQAETRRLLESVLHPALNDSNVAVRARFVAACRGVC
jgi:type I restriction enzyme S subunit